MSPLRSPFTTPGHAVAIHDQHFTTTTKTPPSSATSTKFPPLSSINNKPTIFPPSSSSLRRAKRSMATLTESPATTVRSQHQRRNSVLSDFDSLDEVLIPTADSSTWHSIPLAFAVLPAVGGVLWTDGSALVTDVMLLLLATVFLHWLVKFPWEWYHASQTMPPSLDISPPVSPSVSPYPTAASISNAAQAELRRNELLALASTFFGPLLGGWLLHALRAQLSRPSEGLVSNFNLTIFVLTAELRPTAQVIRLMRTRSVYLHSVLHAPPPGRVEALEAKLEGLQRETRRRDGDVEALIRAVRRYEKKETAAAAATARSLADLDARIRDTLTLAAVAADSKQQPSVAGLMGAAVVLPWSVAWWAVGLPARFVEGCFEAVRGSKARRGRLLMPPATLGKMEEVSDEDDLDDITVREGQRAAAVRDGRRVVRNKRRFN